MSSVQIKHDSASINKNITAKIGETINKFPTLSVKKVFSKQKPANNQFFEYLPKNYKLKKKVEPLKNFKSKKFINTAAPIIHSISNNKNESKETFSENTKKFTFLTKIDVNEYNILYIDEQIKKRLSSNISSIDELQLDLNVLLWIMKNGIDQFDKSQAKTQSIILRKRIQDIEGGFELSWYILQTMTLLIEYKNITEILRDKTFIFDKNYQKDYNTILKKNRIVCNYLKIARNYIDLENFKQPIQKMMCNAIITNKNEICQSFDFEQTEDDSIFICKKCGNQIEFLDDAPSFKDTDRVNMSTRYTYSTSGHFTSAIDHFEGKQNIDMTIIRKKIMPVLEDEMNKHSLNKKSVTKDQLYMFMYEKKLSDYYEDLNLIHFLITDKQCPDITKYRNELLEMVKYIEDGYKEVKEKEKINSLNVNFKLYKLLQLLGYPCKRDDFYFLKTDTKLKEHNEKWIEIIDYLEKKYPDAKTSSGLKRWRPIRTI